VKRAWIELRPFVSSAAILVVYAIGRLTFLAVAGERGVLDHARVDGTIAALALATFVLRVFALVVVPMTVTYRLAMRLARRWLQ
jgi:hypothetical protein